MQDDIKSNLCVYDKRHPDYAFKYTDDPDRCRPKNCCCDNCFYGKHELAEKILMLLEACNTVKQFAVKYTATDSKIERYALTKEAYGVVIAAIAKAEA